ncbi:MAG: type II secretion system F family protein [Candidatus Bathyarchaeota archaeon]|nr:type II secretion system F family protein [Candidatus Bathyarchaeota archaeon]
MYFQRKLKLAVFAVSAAVGIIVMLLPLLSGLYAPTQPYLVPLSQQVNNTFALGMIIILVFPAVVEYSNYRWVKQVEHAIPRVLRDIAEAVRSGITLPRAVEEASQKGYGPLSDELEQAISRFVLGASWEEAIMSLTKKVNNSALSRFATILVEANQAGGKMGEVLNSSVELFSSLEEFKEEQANNTRPYLLTIYLALTIFLIITYVMLTQFLGPLSGTTLENTGNLTANVLDINYYASILFWASIIESLFGGLIAGKIGDRSYSAGLRHSVILLLITVAFFNVLGNI